MMAGIRSKDTMPELAIRRALHRLGFRYRLHDKRVPGKPDLFLPKYRAAIFINGCFWHRHECALFKMPSTRTEFWRQKLETNCDRDARVRRELDRLGIRHLTIWECEVKRKNVDQIRNLIERCVQWLSEGKGAV